MKTINHTHPQVSSLTLSRELTEALEGIGVEVDTYFQWWGQGYYKTFYSVESIRSKIDEQEQVSLQCPAYSSSTLMRLLKTDDIGNEFYLIYLPKRDCFAVYWGPILHSERALTPEDALAKMLIHLIKEGLIKEGDLG
jgi:hypothetical protein